jgi:hypothetical protein
VTTYCQTVCNSSFTVRPTIVRCLVWPLAASLNKTQVEIPSYFSLNVLGTFLFEIFVVLFYTHFLLIFLFLMEQHFIKPLGSK